MPTHRSSLLTSIILLGCAASLAAAPDTPARVEIGLVQTAAANPPIGTNNLGDPGGTRYSAGNLIPDAGFEPMSIRRHFRVDTCGIENGCPWFTVAGQAGGMTAWDLVTTGFLNGASVRVYRIVDVAGQPLPQGRDNYLDLTNAAAYTLVSSTTIPEAGAAGLPLGGWVDTAYATPSSDYGTRASLNYTDARWVENGRTYYYIVTAIGSNSTDDTGVNESDPATAVELTAIPQAGLPSTPHIYVSGGSGLKEIGNVATGEWYNFRPRLAGATGTVTWELLDASNNPITPPAGLAFNPATGELGGSATSTPPATLLRFRATAANGTATRDFILNNPAWTPTGGTTRPLPPTNITATAGDGYVHLSWTASATPDVVGYRVYRAEVPRAQQRQRIYLAPGAPALVKDDYVHLEKRILVADPKWSHPRVRSGSVTETWRNGGDPAVAVARVAHPGAIPAEFRFPGDACMSLSVNRSGGVEIDGPYIFYPFNSGSESEWYAQLEPGRTYRYEAWMRQEGLAGGGEVALGFAGQYAGISRTFAVDGQWRLYGFEFTAPERPTTGNHGCAAIRVTGPGRLWFDNIRLFRADTPADITATLTPPSPYVFDELMASQPLTGEKGMLRSMPVLLNKGSMANALNLNGDAVLTLDWNQTIEPPASMTVPYFLQYALRTGSSPADRMKPWLSVSSRMSEQEWVQLVEYLAAPIDPNNPADVAAKPWAYLRYRERGVATPWTDEFSRIYLEFANETWHNGRVSDEWFGWSIPGAVQQGAKEFGLVANHFSTFIRDHSPHFAASAAAGKLRLVMGSNYEDYAERAAPDAPDIDAIAHVSYVGPKWETGEPQLATYDDHGMQATLLCHLNDSALLYRRYNRSREQLILSGQPIEFLGYEGGPHGYALLEAHPSPEQVEIAELYGKSLAMGVAALDAWLGANRYGFTDQAYLGFALGNGWSSHTTPNKGTRPHPAWLALTLRNRFASGRMIDAVVTSTPTIPWDGAEHPLVSSYAFRDGRRLGVFLLSRKLGGVHDGIDFGDGSTPVTLVLPGNPTGPATLYHLTGDPRTTNREAMNITIQQRSVTLDRETTVTLPQGSIHLYVVDTDLPDRDDPPPAPALPTIAFATGGATLDWPAVAGATGYTVYRSSLPFFDRSEVGATFTTDTNTFADPAAVGDTTYYYRVAANNDWGTGFWTDAAVGGLNTGLPPLTPPQIGTVFTGFGTIELLWAPVAGAERYTIGLAATAGGPYVWADVGNATSHTYSDLVNGVTYYLVVRAHGQVGTGPLSTEVSGTPSANGGMITLASWEAAPLIYSSLYDQPELMPTILPVTTQSQGIAATAVTRGNGATIQRDGHGMNLGAYDGKFPIYPTNADCNFGAPDGGSLADVVARDLYIGTTIAPTPGHSLSIGAIDAGFQYPFGEWQNHLSVALRYRVGGGDWHEVPVSGYFVETQVQVFNNFTLAVANEAALQNVTEPIDLRFYLYSTNAVAAFQSAALVRSSGPDLVVRGTVQFAGVPGQPAGLLASGGSNRVSLSWTPVSGATSYTLRWGTAAGTYTGSLAGLTQATATVTSLPNGVPHYFVVEAVNPIGTGPQSAEAVATPRSAFQAWQSAHFTAAQVAAGLGAMAADPDNDGQANLVEYAFGSDPLAAGAPAYQIGLSGTPARLTATLPLRADNDDITVTLEASSDLVTWTPLARSTAWAAMSSLATGVTVNSTGTAPVTVTVTDAVGGATDAVPRRFFRVSIAAP